MSIICNCTKIALLISKAIIILKEFNRAQHTVKLKISQYHGHYIEHHWLDVLNASLDDNWSQWTLFTKESGTLIEEPSLNRIINRGGRGEMATQLKSFLCCCPTTTIKRQRARKASVSTVWPLTSESNEHVNPSQVISTLCTTAGKHAQKSQSNERFTSVQKRILQRD